jgi:hypothetical protein
MLVEIPARLVLLTAAFALLVFVSAADAARAPASFDKAKAGSLVAPPGNRHAQNMARDKKMSPSSRAQDACEADEFVVHVSPETGKQTRVYRRKNSRVIFYQSGMTIDADGAPNAYHPIEELGLDDLRQAGRNGDWWGVVVDQKGEPVVQRHGDFAGFYVSQTWLRREDGLFPDTDARHWVDAREVRYIAIPKTVWEPAGIGPGDLAMVVNMENGKASYAIVADWGTEDTLGEGSIALAIALEIAPDARLGGTDKDVFYVVFPNSAAKPRWPRRPAEMSRSTRRLFAAWGGREKVAACRAKEP